MFLLHNEFQPSKHRYFLLSSNIFPSVSVYAVSLSNPLNLAKMHVSGYLSVTFFCLLCAAAQNPQESTYSRANSILQTVASSFLREIGWYEPVNRVTTTIFVTVGSISVVDVTSTIEGLSCRSLPI
jgi:hypothetical protein